MYSALSKLFHLLPLADGLAREVWRFRIFVCPSTISVCLTLCSEESEVDDASAAPRAARGRFKFSGYFFCVFDFRGATERFGFRDSHVLLW